MPPVGKPSATSRRGCVDPVGSPIVSSASRRVAVALRVNRCAGWKPAIGRPAGQRLAACQIAIANTGTASAPDRTRTRRRLRGRVRSGAIERRDREHALCKTLPRNVPPLAVRRLQDPLDPLELPQPSCATRAVRDVRTERGLVDVGGADSHKFCKPRVRLVVRHSPSSAKSASRPSARRIRALTVPSGKSRRCATWLCVRSSKYASSSAVRSPSESRARLVSSQKRSAGSASWCVSGGVSCGTGCRILARFKARVTSDRVHPGGSAAASWIELFRVAPDPHERLLRGVLGRVLIDEDPPTDRVDRSAAPRPQRDERSLAPAGHQPQELRVTRIPTCLALSERHNAVNRVHRRHCPHLTRETSPSDARHPNQGPPGNPTKHQNGTTMNPYRAP